MKNLHCYSSSRNNSKSPRRRHDDHNHHHQPTQKQPSTRKKYSNRNPMFILACSIVVLLIYFLCGWFVVGRGLLFMTTTSRTTTTYNHKDDEEHHTIPTLLSVVDDQKPQKYLNALEHSLYKELKLATTTTWMDNFNNDDYYFDGNIKDYPTLSLSPEEIAPRGALTLSWTYGSTTDNNDNAVVVQDDDILLLYCKNDHEKTSFPKETSFLDACTIAQAKATSQKHLRDLEEEEDRKRHNIHNNVSSSSSSSSSSWYFPRFPVQRYDVCHFKLYQRIMHNNKDNDDDGDDDKTTSSSLAFLATSNPVRIQNANNLATSIHLALGNDSDEMVVQFQTGAIGIPVVKYYYYYNNNSKTILTAKGTSSTYQASDMCQAPANLQEPGKFQSPGQLHVVRLTSLESNTQYHYQVGIQTQQKQLSDSVDIDDDNIVWSETYSFVSPPQLQEADNIMEQEPLFSFLVYGDQGCPSNGWGQGGAWTAAMVAREGSNIKMVHHFGDLSYARGAAHVWEDWLDMIAPFTTRVPLMIAVGNHEYDHTSGGDHGKDPSGETSKGGYHPPWGNYWKDSGGECGVPTARRFTMPTTKTTTNNGDDNINNSNGVFWYSYDYANLHTTVISSEHDVSVGSRQYQWLEQDLKSVDRDKTPWLLLELHRPLYEAHVDPSNWLVQNQMRKPIEPLLKKYQVDLVLGGHFHSYQRSCPGLYQSKCDSGGPTHITVGTAGAVLRPFVGRTRRKHWTERFITGTYGYGRVTVANATALHFAFVQAGSDHDPDAGKILDETWIIKEHNNNNNYNKHRNSNNNNNNSSNMNNNIRSSTTER